VLVSNNRGVVWVGTYGRSFVSYNVSIFITIMRYCFRL
jgi:hypothetical protein